MERTNESSIDHVSHMLQFAERLRRSAEAEIVTQYRQSLEGHGDGPTDASLRVFARLVAYETRLERRVSASRLSMAVRADPMAAPMKNSATDLPKCGAAPSHAVEPPHAAPPLPLAVPSPQPLETTPASHAVPARAQPRRMPIAALASLCVLVVSVAVTSVVSRWRAMDTVSAVALAPSATPIMPTATPLAPQRNTPVAAIAAPSTALSFEANKFAAVTVVPPVHAPAGKSARKARSAPTKTRSASAGSKLPALSLVAACGGMNFLSRAVCMNNVCAKPELTRSRSCADSVRQRRIDEARRDPFLMN